MRKANVYYRNRFAGIIIETMDGYEFKYDSKYFAGGTPLGFNFPFQEHSFISKTLPSYFENLVSEGWLRKLQSQEQKIDESDKFGLLLKNGLDLVGAVTVDVLEE